MKPTMTTTTTTTTTTKHRIFFWNLNLKPTFLDYGYGCCRSATARARQVVERIASLQDPAPDTLCFCEVWDYGARRTLKTELGKLKYKYQAETPYVACCCCCLNAWPTAGLLILSKRKIGKRHYKLFANKGRGFDRLVHKGVLCCEIGNVQVVVTHLQSGGHRKDEDVRESQLRDVKRAITERMAPHSVVCGDFNTAVNACRCILDETTVHPDPVSSRRRIDGKIVDHVFATEMLTMKQNAVVIKKTADVSDHDPLFVTVGVPGRTPAVLHLDLDLDLDLMDLDLMDLDLNV